MQQEKSNLWQSPIWEKFQKKLGRKTWFLKNKNAQLLAIKHSLILGYCWIEIPRGPIGKQQDYKKLIQKLIQQTVNEDVVFIRIMPEIQDSGQTMSSFGTWQTRKAPKKNYQLPTTNYQLKKAHANHHPETTLKIDLTLSEEEILKQMKAKGRYNIKLSQKKGVVVQKSKDISAFFKLIQETTKRNQFWGHSENYYKIMLNVFKEKAQLLLAKYEGKVIAGGLFVCTQKDAIYYYGASSNQNRNVMAPYLIQWTAIQKAKKKGCKTYDFLGIAPENASKKHPWKGVTSFKKKFGGYIENHSIAQEIVLKPLHYKLLVFLKKLKSFIK